MKHKIKIHRVNGRWYAECAAGGCSGSTSQGPDGYFGRTTWDAALAVGIAHQQDIAQGRCRCNERTKTGHRHG